MEQREVEGYFLSMVGGTGCMRRHRHRHRHRHRRAWVADTFTCACVEARAPAAVTRALASAAAAVQGCLIPPAHSAYWIGLTTNDEPKDANSWFWLDHTPSPNPNNYVHWGTRKPVGLPEPANYLGAEVCGVANFSESYAGTWGWASQQCNQNLAYMCEKNRGWRSRLKAWVELPSQLLRACLAALSCRRIPTDTCKCAPLPRSPWPVLLQLKHHQQQLHPEHVRELHLGPGAVLLQRQWRQPGQLAQRGGAAGGGEVLRRNGEPAPATSTSPADDCGVVCAWPRRLPAEHP
jgi:hypothetical protein